MVAKGIIDFWRMELMALKMPLPKYNGLTYFLKLNYYFHLQKKSARGSQFSYPLGMRSCKQELKE